jgi:hypothetical protein
MQILFNQSLDWLSFQICEDLPTSPTKSPFAFHAQGIFDRYSFAEAPFSTTSITPRITK